MRTSNFKRIVLLSFLGILLSFSSVFAQSEEVVNIFNKKFPALAKGEKEKLLSGDIDNAKQQELKELTDNLNLGLDDMDAFKISPKDPIMSFFTKKDLKSKIFKKEPEKAATELKGLIIEAKKDIRDYMADKTQWGIDPRQAQRNISSFIEFKKQKHYKEAYGPWTYAFLYSPRAHKAIYISGEEILKGLIEQEKDVKQKENYIDTLMLLYNQRIKYFNQKGYVLGKKGINLIKYRPTAILEAYGYLKESIELEKEKSSPATMLVYMQATSALFKSQTNGADGNPVVSADKVISTYNTLNAYINKALSVAKTDSEKRNLAEAQKGIEAHFSESGAANCDALIAIYDPQFKVEANKKDTVFLKKALSMLNKAGCDESDLHFEMSKTLFALSPSDIAAGGIGNRFLKQKEYDNALEYYTKACELCSKNEQLAKYNYQIAMAYKEKGQYSKSRTFAEKAISLKADFGQAYMLIGLLYADSKKQCGKDAFEQNSVYWIAVDQFLKAKNADPSVADQANKLISAYSNRFPNKEEAFMHSVKQGSTVKIGCWIQRSTKARF